MSIRFSLLLAGGVLGASLLLSGCESSEAKAERYFQSGLTLLAAGDTDRAMIEFRNVFKYDGFHKQARQVYADTLLARGDLAGAYSQYLRLIEQYPDTAPVRLTLAESAMAGSDWDEMERHGAAAIALVPEDPRATALRIAIDYRKASLARDAAGRAALAGQARELLAAHPGNKPARRIVIDHLASGATPLSALPVIDAALADDPSQLEFQMMRFRLLVQANDVSGTGAQLKTMFGIFPDNAEVKAALIRWYLVQRDFAGAEAFLRKLAGDDRAAPEGHVTVIQLLTAAGKTEAVRAELDRLAAANAGTPNGELYAALRAGLDFEAGKRTSAIAAMQAIVENAAASDQTRRIKVMLARMIDTEGKREAAATLVEAVLAEDAGNIDALKLRATWSIAADRPGDAILDLRAALNQNPRDAEVLTLMAAAHERDGNAELAGERLALAVEVSGRAAPESLRYARFLLARGDLGVAESVLLDAYRSAPGNADLITALAEVYVTRKSWPQAEGMLAALRRLNNPGLAPQIGALQVVILDGQNRREESLAFLTEQVAKSGDSQAVALTVQAQANAGKAEEARKYLDGVLAKTPDDRDLHLLSAALDMYRGDLAAAEAQYQRLIAADPGLEVAVRMQVSLLAQQGRMDEARAALEAGLAANPRAATLRWIKAGLLEQAGDFDGAIAVYEALYAEDSANVVVANNLASLITTHRAGPDDLERAFAIARRLKGSDVPAFQDTYGWIEYLRGNKQEALHVLETAAAGLPTDALAQFHLAMAQADTGQTELAAESFERMLALAGERPLPQAEVARQRLADLRAAP